MTTAPSMRSTILRFIKQRPVRGYTADEMAAKTGFEYHSVRGRFQDLKREGLIVDSGSTRTTRSNRQASVWLTR